jgi:hypothetical protein
MSQKSEKRYFGETRALNGITRCPGKQVSANRLPTDGPRALTCWHGEFHGFRWPRLCGCRLSHCEGEWCFAGYWQSDCSFVGQVEAGMLRIVIAAKATSEDFR